MAINKKIFFTRTITAILFSAVMLFGLLWNLWSFLVLVILISTFCWGELLSLMEKIENIRFSLVQKLGFLLLQIGLLLSFCGKAFDVFEENFLYQISMPIFFAGIALLFYGYIIFPYAKFKFLKTLVFGIVYLTLSTALLLSLRQSNLFFQENILVIDLGRTFPLFIIFSLWINDTMAYIIGSLIGKHPLHSISPKKTWEGFIGGGLLAAVSMFLIGKYLFGLPNLYSLVLPLIIVITGTIGDLFESKLKRLAGVKDSGTMLPGHGGFLDRFDSLLMATPFVWMFVLLF